MLIKPNAWLCSRMERSGIWSIGGVTFSTVK